MGMAASQARLLSITSRLHDVEYKAQNIESQKLQLATQRDDLYNKYNAKLDAKKIQVAMNGTNGARTYIDANFVNITSYNPKRSTNYCLKDARTGKVIVDQDTANMYYTYKNDKYMFAWAMMGYNDNLNALKDDPDNFKDPCEVGVKNQDSTWIAMSNAEEEVFEAHKEDADSTLIGAYNAYKEIPEDDIKAKKDALAEFRKILYSDKSIREEIYEKINPNTINNPENYEDFDNEKFNFYIHLFENIEASFGYVAITDFAGDTTSYDNEWLNNMVNSGQVLIDVYNKNGPNAGWEETSLATSISENYLQETNDTTGLEKAKAEYEYELGVINRKDTKFDKELSKLETERNALKTEYDSIKQVRDDNIERTYNIFS